MLCSLAVRRVREPDGNGFSFVLRLTGKRTLGSAGTVGSDERSFSTQAELVLAMRALAVAEDVIVKAEEIMAMEAFTRRHVIVSADVQIPFSSLEECGYDLFD